MIKANELRIGNWLNDFWDNLFIVTAKTLVDIENSLKFHPPKPIPLTPEILEKCGFGIWDMDTTVSSYKIRIGEFINLLININYGFCAIIHDQGNCSADFSCIKHLHQLQNLYFALTGEELEIKNLEL